MSRVIRWGIWGTGSIAHQVASDFPLVKGAVIQAVASRTPERAQRFASRHGIAQCYSTLESLLSDSDVDVVYVATPNYRHVDDCLTCIQMGKAVLCEKPFALNLGQARQIADAARKRRVFCMEAMWTRFIPAVMEAKRWIEDGAIGAIRMMQGNFAYPVPVAPESRLFDPLVGGGALLDRGVYLISLAQQLLGVPQLVRGTACLGSTGVDDQSGYQLVYANGALADFTASLRVRGTNEMTIFGERGQLRLCDPFYRPHRLVLQSSALPPAAVREDLSSKKQGLRDAPATKLMLRRMGPLLDFFRRGRHFSAGTAINECDLFHTES